MPFGFYLFDFSQFSDPDALFGGSEDNTPFGTGPGSNLSLNSTASGTVIETTVGPDDNGAPLTNPVTVNGTTYPAGTNVEAEYEIIFKGPQPAPGEPQLYYRVAGIQIGNDWAGVVVSQPWRADTGEYVTDAPVPRGLTLTAIDGDDLDGTPNKNQFTSDSNYAGNGDIVGNDSDLGAVGGTIPCFTSGTLIEVADGASVVIDELEVGDLVRTRDSGLQPIRWIGRRRLDRVALQDAENLRPIRISRGALDADVPAQDLLVSPQHRVLARSNIAQRMFGTDEVLVAAKQLRALDGIETAEDVPEVTYFHILFDQHEVVMSNGAETESLYTGPEALKSVSDAALEEIFTLFPELQERDFMPQSARLLVPAGKARQLAEQHQQDRVSLVC